MTETAIKPDSDQKSDPEIDEDLLAEAQRALGTPLRNEAINAALREYVEAKREQRLQAYDYVQRLVAEGALDLSKLDEDDE